MVYFIIFFHSFSIQIYNQSNKQILKNKIDGKTMKLEFCIVHKAQIKFRILFLHPPVKST